jgi:hypothetical protein
MSISNTRLSSRAQLMGAGAAGGAPQRGPLRGVWALTGTVECKLISQPWSKSCAPCVSPAGRIGAGLYLLSESSTFLAKHRPVHDIGQSPCHPGNAELSYCSAVRMQPKICSARRPVPRRAGSRASPGSNTGMPVPGCSLRKRRCLRQRRMVSSRVPPFDAGS